MKKSYVMVIEKDEGGFYVGNIPELPGCHTQGRTLDELNRNMEEALSLYLECLEEINNEEFIPIEFVGVQKVSVA